jgi:hypothetical protein
LREAILTRQQRVQTARLYEVESNRSMSIIPG